MKTASAPVNSNFYNKCLTNFSKQFADISRMVKVYVNEENKVFAGEWVDVKGCICFNGGFAVDAVKVIEFKD